MFFLIFREYDDHKMCGTFELHFLIKLSYGINISDINLMSKPVCRKCIYEKFSDDDVDSCPVCDINLGCVPVEKLRSLSLSHVCFSKSWFIPPHLAPIKVAIRAWTL